MTGRNTTILLSAFVVLASSSAVFANGFILNDHGAKATGRADAVTASVEDGSSVVYNPGGLAVRDGVNIYIGTSLVFPQSSFTYDQTGETTNAQTSVGVTPTLFAHAKLGFANPSLDGVFSVGLGVHAPFGSKLAWGADSPGAEENRLTNLRALFVTPAVGVDLQKWVPGLSIGGGLDVVPASVELNRDVFFGDVRGSANLGGKGVGLGGRIGALYRSPNLPVSLGVAYRSQVDLEMKGSGDFDAPAPFRSRLPADGDISASASLPASFLAGIAVRPLANLEVEANLQWMEWSTFETIALVLPDEQDLDLERGYQDTMTWRFGAEYSFPTVGADIRGGYAYDPSPIPAERLSVSLPDINRHVVSGGASFDLPSSWLGSSLQDFYVDVGVLYVIPGTRRTSDEPFEPQLKGEFGVSALVTSLSLGARFGKGATQTTPRFAAAE